MMLNAARRLRDGILVRCLKRGPLDFARRRACWNQPIIARLVGAVRELHLDAAFERKPLIGR